MWCKLKIIGGHRASPLFSLRNLYTSFTVKNNDKPYGQNEMLACYKRLPFRVCTRTLPNKTYNFPPLIRAYPHKQTNLELSQFETSK